MARLFAVVPMRLEADALDGPLDRTRRDHDERDEEDLGPEDHGGGHRGARW